MGDSEFEMGTFMTMRRSVQFRHSRGFQSCKRMRSRVVNDIYSYFEVAKRSMFAVICNRLFFGLAVNEFCPTGVI